MSYDANGAGTEASGATDTVAQVVQRLANHRSVDSATIDIVARFPSKRADSSHGCPGELFVDSYVDSDGFEHIVISTWYECDSFLEIEDDLILLG